MTTATYPRILDTANMGHEYMVIEQSDHWTAVDGWRVVAHCNTLSAAKRLRDNSEQPIYRKALRGWKKVRTS